MHKELKTKWLNALRSGNYKQTTGVLIRDGISFCCIGVLCDVVEHVEVFDDYVFSGITNTELEIDLDRGTLFAIGLTREEAERLMCMNDEGSSFQDIADYIEENI